MKKTLFMETTLTEENYLKAIYQFGGNGNKVVSTNSLADALDTKASSVTDMIKKLSEKELVNYEKYQGVHLTKEGEKIALNIIRKHRLWEVFLVEKLNFRWDEVHDIAEYLEHVNSNVLFERLEKFLGHPKFDPHGDPIPNKDGDFTAHEDFCLLDMKKGSKGKIVGVKQHTSAFLQYLENLNLVVGAEIKVLEKLEFENSVKIEVRGKEQILSGNVGDKLYIAKI